MWGIIGAQLALAVPHMTFWTKNYKRPRGQSSFSAYERQGVVTVGLVIYVCAYLAGQVPGWILQCARTICAAYSGWAGHLVSPDS